MTDRTQHVIDAIDGALGDWSVSSDAMRWTPEPEIPFGLERRRPVGFRGGRVPPPIVIDETHHSTSEAVQLPRREGRGLLAFGNGVVHHLVGPDGLATWQGALLSEIFGSAFREACEAMARLFHAVEEAAAPLAALRDQLADDVDEDPRARALRLRRERNTGPSRDLTRQRRPRRLS
jgi:hypothetical protein